MALDLDQSGRIPQVEKVYLGPTLGWRYIDKPIDVEFVISGGGSQIAPGFKGILQMPEWLYVQQWILMSDQQGSMIMDVYKISLAQAAAQVPINNPAFSITGSEQPTILGGNSYGTASTLAGWNRNFDQNDILGFVVVNNTTLFRATLILECVTLKGFG